MTAPAETPKESPHAKGTILAAAAAAVLLSLALRLWRIGDESVWSDEAVSLQILNAPSLVDYIRIAREQDPALIPGYYALSYLWYKVVGDSVVLMRLLPLLCSVATTIALFALGRRLAGLQGALVAVFLYSISVTHVFLGQDLRYYGFTFLFGLLSLIPLLSLCERNTLPAWVAHLTANTLLVWTHLFGVTIIFAQAAALLLLWRQHKARLALWVALHAALAVSVALWVLTIDFKAAARFTDWIPPITWDAWVNCLVHLAGRTAVFMPSHGLAPRIEEALGWWLLAVLLWAAAYLGYVLHTRADAASNHTQKHAYALLLAWVVVPLTLLTLAAVFWKDCFLARYITPSILPAMLLPALALRYLRTPRARAAALFFILAPHVAQAALTLPARPFRTDWNSAMNLVQTSARPGERLVYLNSDWGPRQIIEYYGPRKGILLRGYADPPQFAKGIADALAAGNGVWIIDVAEEQRPLPTALPDWPQNAPAPTVETRLVPSGYQTLAVHHMTPSERLSRR